LGRPVLLAPDEVAQGTKVFGHLVANKPRRLTASTPGAGQDLIKRHVVARKRRPGAARLGTSVFAQIALGCAVVETKAHRITGAARSIRVTHEGGMPGLPKRLPRIRLSPGVAGPRQQRRRHPQDATEQPLR
jgi:hypothetical protein